MGGLCTPNVYVGEGGGGRGGGGGGRGGGVGGGGGEGGGWNIHMLSIFLTEITNSVCEFIKFYFKFFSPMKIQLSVF